ncbi:MerR family transcriptional regulator [Nocardia brasiliensis]|uniref:MerR family transcriptional regulator n=1 Tax=Nocardia brasiliensis TaxID=37326 RepID=UPI003D8E0EDA
MAADTEFTIDELAREAGTTVRSLRVYHERGVLPPPQVKGRTGFYGDEHLNRVRTIGRLLDRGIKLNGIRELLEAWDRGDDLGDVLGVPDQEPHAHSGVPAALPDPAAPIADVDETLIAATELADLYRDVPNGFARVVAAGLYEPLDAATYRVADRPLLRIVEQLCSAGATPVQALDEVERLQGDCDRIARRFVETFERTAWQAFRQSGRTAADRNDLAERVAGTRILPGQAAADLVGRFIARYLERDLPELGDELSGR